MQAKVEERVIREVVIRMSVKEANAWLYGSGDPMESKYLGTPIKALLDLRASLHAAGL